LEASVHALKILGSGAKPRPPHAIRRAISCGTIRRILRPKRPQTTMKAWNAGSRDHGGVRTAEGTNWHGRRQTSL